MESVLKSSFKVLSYTSTLVPLVVCHYIIPPLSHYTGQEKYASTDWQYDMTPAKFQPTMKNYYNVCKLGYRDRTAYILCYQRLTYIFVHVNNNHLESNLIALVYASYPVYRQLGAFGFCMTFILGGISASIPSVLSNEIKEVQKEYNLLNLKKELMKRTRWPIFIMPAFLVSRLDSWMKTYAMNLITSIDQFSIGSSGAVFTIFGCNAYYFVQDSYKLSRSGINIYNTCKNFSFFSYLLCASTVQPVFLELKTYYAMHEKLPREASAPIYDNIGHADHLQGAAFGFILAAYIKSLSRYGIIRIK